MDGTGNKKRPLFSQQTSAENVRPSHIQHSSGQDPFGRPTSALARHRIHQLSDIREVSGSSRTATVGKRLSGLTDGAKELPSTPVPQGQAKSEGSSSEYGTPTDASRGRTRPPRVLGSRATSTMSLLLQEVPERRSSASIFAQSLGGSRQASLQDLPAWKVPPMHGSSQAIPNRGRADSPVRNALNRSAQSSEGVRLQPSRTFIRTTPPVSVLDKGSVRHDRVQMSIRLPSPLFVGGGTIEGQVLLEVDGGLAGKNKSKPIYISKLSIDVIGVEEINDGRRWPFLSLASELFDEGHPPPPSLVTSQFPTSVSELCWQLKPSSTVIPFCINLPLNLGPPPYFSKQACIRYILCPTINLRIGDKRSIVRQTWTIQMLTIHDPEKALASLSSPLLATDSITMSQVPEPQTVKLTAGLHRQTWVNSGMIFVDVHVANGTAKSIKKIEVQLEKTTLWYSHAAAGTAEKSASHLRLPKKRDIETVSTTAVKKSKDWKGIPSYSSEVRTCQLEAPRGHVTISTGRYFEVRYFVNVLVTVTMFKSVIVQLPVTLIHMNSLDILPNSLAQVAASIEAKRARTVPVSHGTLVQQPYHQGQAFTAPRKQSLDRSHCDRHGTVSNDINLLTQDLDQSPRRYGNVNQHTRGRPSMVPVGTSHENIPPGRPSMCSSSHHHNLHHPSCYHCHLALNEHGARPSTAMSLPGPKLPRLQVSTSGLGFSESEFEVPADSPPRKVMLSEQERKMINQQKELRLQRQWSQKSRRKKGVDDDETKMQGGRPNGYFGWKNVTAHPNTGPKQPDFGNFSIGGLEAHETPSMERKMSLRKGKEPVRARSKTNPESAISVGGPSMHPKVRRSSERAPRSSFNIDGQSLVKGHHRTSRDRTGRRSVNVLF